MDNPEDVSTKISQALSDPAALEALYNESLTEKTEPEFRSTIETCYQKEPGNMLLAAWHYRLEKTRIESLPARRVIQWGIAIPLCLVNGLIFWLLSDPRLQYPASNAPYLALMAGPIIAILTITYLTISNPSLLKRAIWVCGFLVGLTAYGMLLASPDEGYQILLFTHLPLLSWAAVGTVLLGARSNSDNRFAFLIKSIEVFVTAGLFLIGGIVFGLITLGLFEAINIQLEDVVMRLITVGGAGLIPVLAVAIAYDPHHEPQDQDFKLGLGRLISTLPRLLLPLALVVLIVYLVVIPFNFLAPFQDRDLLIVYNVMLFAVMGMLLGATPISDDDLSTRSRVLLRNLILAVSILVVGVSLYALSAVVYRTILGGMTMNRLTIIGWNTINISLLILLVIQALKHKGAWVKPTQGIFSLACSIYSIWGLLIILLVPLLF